MRFFFSFLRKFVPANANCIRFADVGAIESVEAKKSQVVRPCLWADARRADSNDGIRLLFLARSGHVLAVFSGVHLVGGKNLSSAHICGSLIARRWPEVRM